MNTVINSPELSPLEVGERFKTFQVKGRAGMKMPPHHSTQEAVIVVHQGRAVLAMADGQHVLSAGSTMIIPAGKEHTLTLKEDFKATAIMGVDSQINFI